MIISHKHKFIFIKTEKTAGTSIEIALSKYCGDKDVLTPISPNDEETRRQLSGRVAQNFLIPLARYSKPDLLRALYRRERLRFYNHADASFIRSHVDPEVWESYFKFCFERNPFDKVISWYWWILRNREPMPSMHEFLESGQAARIKGFDLYTKNSRIVVDRVFKYESLDSAMQELSDIVGLPEVPTLPRAKSGHRKASTHYREALTSLEQESISKIFAREIAYFGYQF